jgi:site-specific DNA-cytosine methylase
MSTKIIFGPTEPEEPGNASAVMDPLGNITFLSNNTAYTNWRNKAWGTTGFDYTRGLLLASNDLNSWRRDTWADNMMAMSLNSNALNARTLAIAQQNGTGTHTTISLDDPGIRLREINSRSGEPLTGPNTEKSIGVYKTEGGGMTLTTPSPNLGAGTSELLLPNGTTNIVSGLVNAHVGAYNWLYNQVATALTDDDEQITVGTMSKAHYSSPLGIIYRANSGLRPSPEYLIKVGKMLGLPAADEAAAELQDMRVQGKDEESLYKQINSWDEAEFDFNNRARKPRTAIQRLMAGLNSELPTNFDLYENLDLKNIADELNLLENLPENILAIVEMESQGNDIPRSLRTQIKLQQLMTASHAAAQILILPTSSGLGADLMDANITGEFATEGEKIAANYTIGLATAVFGLDHFEASFAIAGSAAWGLDKDNLKKSWDKLDPMTQKLLQSKGYSADSFSAAKNGVIFSIYANRTAQGLAARNMLDIEAAEKVMGTVDEFFHAMGAEVLYNPLSTTTLATAGIAIPAAFIASPAIFAGAGIWASIGNLAIEGLVLGGIEAGVEETLNSLTSQSAAQARGRGIINTDELIWDGVTGATLGGTVGFGLGGLIGGGLGVAKWTTNTATPAAARRGYFGVTRQETQLAYDAMLLLPEDQKIIALQLAGQGGLDAVTAMRIMADDDAAIDQAELILKQILGDEPLGAEAQDLAAILDAGELLNLGMTRAEAVSFLAVVARDLTGGQQNLGRSISAEDLNGMWVDFVNWRKNNVTPAPDVDPSFIGPMTAGARKRAFINHIIKNDRSIRERVATFASGRDKRRGLRAGKQLNDSREILARVSAGDKSVSVKELENALADGVTAEDADHLAYMIDIITNDAEIIARTDQPTRAKLINEANERIFLGRQAVADDPMILRMMQLEEMFKRGKADTGVTMASGSGTTVRKVADFIEQYLATVNNPQARSNLLLSNDGMIDIVQRLTDPDQIDGLIDVSERPLTADIREWTKSEAYDKVKAMTKARSEISKKLRKARKKHQGNDADLQRKLKIIEAEGEDKLDEIAKSLGLDSGEFSARAVIKRLKEDAALFGIMSRREKAKVVSRALGMLVDRVDPEMVNIGALARDRVAMGRIFKGKISTTLGDKIEGLFARVALWPQAQSRMFRSSIRLIRAGSQFISGVHIGSKNYGKASMSSVDSIIAATKLEQLPVQRFLSGMHMVLGAKRYREFQTLLMYLRKTGTLLNKNVDDGKQLAKEIEEFVGEKFPKLLEAYEGNGQRLLDDIIAGDNMLTDYYMRQFNEGMTNGSLSTVAADPRRYLPDNLNMNLSATKKAELVAAITEMEKELYKDPNAPLNVHVLVEKGWLAIERRSTEAVETGPGGSVASVGKNTYTVPEDSPFFGITGEGAEADARFVIKNLNNKRGFLRNLQDELQKPDTPKVQKTAAEVKEDIARRNLKKNKGERGSKAKRMSDDKDQLLINGETVEEAKLREAKEKAEAKKGAPKPKSEDLAKTKRTPVGTGARSGIGQPLLFTGEEPVQLVTLADGSVKVVTGFTGMGTYELATPGLFSIVRSIEFDEKVVALNNAVHGNNITTQNILDVDPADIAAEKPDVLHVSPVCKNYSQAGSKVREPTDLDRKSAEWTVRAINEVRPPIFSLEQVAAYATDANCEMIVKALRDQGYSVRIEIVNAADWGGAANRNRMILRARRDGAYIPSFEEQFPGRKTGAADWYTTIKDLLDDAPTEDVSDFKWTGESVGPDVDRFLDDRKGVGMPLGEAKNIQAAINAREIPSGKPIIGMGGNASMWIRGQVDADSAMGTMTTGSLVRIYMPDGRVIRATPRMLFRLQGIPDTVSIPTTLPDGKPLTTARMQFGLGNGMHGNTTRLSHDWMQNSLWEMSQQPGQNVDATRASRARNAYKSPQTAETLQARLDAKTLRLTAVYDELENASGKNKSKLEAESDTLSDEISELNNELETKKETAQNIGGGTASGITDRTPFGGTASEDATARAAANGIFFANKEIVDLEVAKAELTRLDPRDMSVRERVDTLLKIEDINTRLQQANARSTEAINTIMEEDFNTQRGGRMLADLNHDEVVATVNDPRAYDALSPAHKMLRHRLDLLIESKTITEEGAKIVLMTYANINPHKITGISLTTTTIWDRMVEVNKDPTARGRLGNGQLAGDLNNDFTTLAKDHKDIMRRISVIDEDISKATNAKELSELLRNKRAWENDLENNKDAFDDLVLRMQDQGVSDDLIQAAFKLEGTDFGAEWFDPTVLGSRPDTILGGREEAFGGGRIELSNILSRDSAETAARIIVHELGHSLLNQSTRPMKLVMRRMYDTFMDNPDGPMAEYLRRVLKARGDANPEWRLDYARQDVHEFVALLAEISLVDARAGNTPQQAEFFNRIRQTLKNNTQEVFTNRIDALKAIARETGVDENMVDMVNDAMHVLYSTTTEQNEFAARMADFLGIKKEAWGEQVRADREVQWSEGSNAYASHPDAPDMGKKYKNSMTEDESTRLRRLQEESDWRELTADEQAFINDKLLGARDVDPNQQLDTPTDWAEDIKTLSSDDQAFLWKLYEKADGDLSDNIMRQLIQDDFTHTVTTSGAAGTVYRLKEMSDDEIASWIKKRNLQASSEVEGKRPSEGQASDYALMRGSGEDGKLDHATRWNAFLTDVEPVLIKIAEDSPDSKTIHSGLAIIQLLAEFGDELESKGLISTTAADALQLNVLTNVGRYTKAELKKAGEVYLWTSTLKKRDPEMYNKMLTRFKEIGGKKVTAYTALMQSPGGALGAVGPIIRAAQESKPIQTPTVKDVVNNSPAVEAAEAAALSNQAGKIAPDSVVTIKGLIKLADDTEVNTLEEFLILARSAWGDDAVLDQHEVIADYFNKINPNRVEQIAEWDLQAGTVEPSAAKRELRGKLIRLYAELRRKIARDEGLPSGSDVRATLDIEEKLRSLGVQDSFFNAMNGRYMSADALKARLRSLLEAEFESLNRVGDKGDFDDAVRENMLAVGNDIQKSLKRLGYTDEEVEEIISEISDEIFDNDFNAEAATRGFDEGGDSTDDGLTLDLGDEAELFDNTLDVPDAGAGERTEQLEFAKRFGPFFWMSLEKEIPTSLRKLAEESNLDMGTVVTFDDLIERMRSELYDTEELEALLQRYTSSAYDRFDRMDLLVADIVQDIEKTGDVPYFVNSIIEELAEKHKADLDTLYEKLFEFKAELDKVTDRDLVETIDRDFAQSIKTALWFLPFDAADEFVKTGKVSKAAADEAAQFDEYVQIMDGAEYYREGQRILDQWFLAPANIEETILAGTFNEDGDFVGGLKENDVPDFIWRNLEQIQDYLKASKRLKELTLISDPPVAMVDRIDYIELKKLQPEDMTDEQFDRMYKIGDHFDSLLEVPDSSSKIPDDGSFSANKQNRFQRIVNNERTAEDDAQLAEYLKSFKEDITLDEVIESMRDYYKLENKLEASYVSADTPAPTRSPIDEPVDTDEVLADALDDLYKTEVKGRAKPSDSGSGKPPKEPPSDSGSGKPPKEPPKDPPADTGPRGKGDGDGVPNKAREEMIDRLLGRGKNSTPSHTGKINPKYEGDLVADYDDTLENGTAIHDNNVEYVTSNSANIAKTSDESLDTGTDLNIAVKRSAQGLDHRLARRFDDATYETELGKRIAMMFAENMDLLENFTAYGTNFAARIRVQTAMNQLSGGRFKYDIGDLLNNIEEEGYDIIRTSAVDGSKSAKWVKKEKAQFDKYVQQLRLMYLQSIGYNMTGASGGQQAVTAGLRIAQNMAYSKAGGLFAASVLFTEGTFALLRNGGLGPLQNLKNAGTLLLGIAKIVAGESATNIPGIPRLMSYFGLDQDSMRYIGMDIIEAMKVNDGNVMAKFGLPAGEGANATVFTWTQHLQAHLRALREAGEENTTDYAFLVKCLEKLESATGSMAELTGRGSGMSQMLDLVRMIGCSVGSNALVKHGDRLIALAEALAKLGEREQREISLKDVRTLARKHRIPRSVAVFAADAGLLRNAGSSLKIAKDRLNLKFGRGGSRGGELDMVLLQREVDNANTNRGKGRAAGFRPTDAELRAAELEQEAITNLSTYFRSYVFQYSPEFRGADKFTGNPLMSLLFSMTTYSMAAYQHLIANGVAARGVAASTAVLGGIGIVEFFNRTMQSLLYGNDEDKRQEAKDTLNSIMNGTAMEEDLITAFTTYGSTSPLFGASGKYVKDVFGNPTAAALGGNPQSQYSATPFVGATGGILTDIYKKGIHAPIRAMADPNMSSARKDSAYAEGLATGIDVFTPFNNSVFNTISTATTGKRFSTAIAEYLFNVDQQRQMGNTDYLYPDEGRQQNLELTSPRNPYGTTSIDALNSSGVKISKPPSTPVAPEQTPLPDLTTKTKPVPKKPVATSDPNKKGGSDLIDNLDSN